MDVVRVSHSGFFFLVSVRATRMELWCLKSLECLYELESNDPYLVALDWAPVKCVPRDAGQRSRKPSGPGSKATTPSGEDS